MADKTRPLTWIGKAAESIEKILYPRDAPADRSAPPTNEWWPGENPVDRSNVGVGEVWDKQSISSLLVSAQSGELTRFSIFKTEMRASSAHLDGELRKVESFLTLAPFEINPPQRFTKASNEKSPEAKAAGEIADYVREQILDPDVKIKEVIRHFFWGLCDSVAGVQPLVDPGGAEKGREKLVSITPIPSQRFNYIPATTILAVTPGDEPAERVPVSAYGAGLAVIIADAHTPNPARRGVLRRCLTPWLAHRYGVEWWGRALELSGVPFRKGKYPANNDKLRVALETAMRNQGASAFAVFPEGTDIEVIAEAMALGGSHREWAEFHEMAMSKAITGSTQTAQIQRGAGSRASAVVHQDIMEVFCESYGRQICEAIREQIVRPLVMRNFGEEQADLLTPTLTLNIHGYEDLTTFSSSLATLVQTGLAIPANWAYERSGVPRPEDNEETLTGQTVADAKAQQDTADAAKLAAKQPKPAPFGQPGQKPPAAKVLPFGKKKATMSARQTPGDEITMLEDQNESLLDGAGEEITAEFSALIEETRRDGGDLGHLAARVRILARQQDRSVTETARLIETVISAAMLAGLSSAEEA